MRTWLLMAWTGLAVTAMAGDWPRWRGPAGDGHADEPDWFKAGTPGKTVWERDVGAGYSAVSVADGRLYTMGHGGGQDRVYCLDAASGAELWTHAYPCEAGSYPGPRCTPTVAGEGVYTLSRRGLLLCLDRKNGKVRWSRDLAADSGAKAPSWGFTSSPLVAGDLVVVNVGTNGLAVNKDSGKTVWESGGAGASYASPVAMSLAGRTAVLMFIAEGLVASELATGRRLWGVPWKTSYDVNASDPLPVGNRVLITSGYKRGGALLDVSGAAPVLVWEGKELASHFSTPVLLGDHVYGGHDNTGRGDVRCVEVATGKVKWSTRDLGYGSCIRVGQHLLILGERGMLVVAPAVPDGYRPAWQQQVLDGTCWTMPVVSQGRVYCRNDKGRLICLDLR